MKRLQHGYAEGNLGWADVAASVQAWNAHSQQGTTWRLRDDVFEKAVFVRSGSASASAKN